MPWYKYNLDLTKNTAYDSAHLNPAQLTGPVLPLAFANFLWILYTLHTDDDCEKPYLDFCLAAGCISLICVIIGLASKIMVEDAWADGMLSRKESAVVWLMINSHHLMLISQVILFFVFFVYVVSSFNNIVYEVNQKAAGKFYCKREIYLTCLIMSSVFCASCLFALFMVLLFWAYTRIGAGDSNAEEEIEIPSSTDPDAISTVQPSNKSTSPPSTASNLPAIIESTRSKSTSKRSNKSQNTRRSSGSDSDSSYPIP